MDYLRTAVASGPLQQGADPGLIAQRSAESGRTCRLPSGDPSRLRCELGELRSEWPWMAAVAKIAGIAAPPGAPGAGMCERDLLAVPKARHDLQRDSLALFRRVLPLDP
ncbi:MAG: hypothetical protein QOD01_2213 [Actinomycetota bacterium]|nr:hypothetical protein [Actinomycetota bacterium]